MTTTDRLAAALDHLAAVAQQPADPGSSGQLAPNATGITRITVTVSHQDPDQATAAQWPDDSGTDQRRSSGEWHGRVRPDRTGAGPRTGGGLLAAASRPTVPARLCPHADGHELKLSAPDVLRGEVRQQCPCCDARLWIGVPAVAALLQAAALAGASRVPGLDVALTRRERQVLAVLHRAPTALRSEQLAALVWSDPYRTHDVRTVLHRLRRKLRGSGWSIPTAPRGGGLRLVRGDAAALAA